MWLGIQNAREWTRLCADVLRWRELADDERFRTNPLRVKNRRALHDVVESAFLTLSTSDVIERLESARIAWARMNSVAELLDHPQLAQRGCWRDVESPAGAPRAIIPPGTHGRGRARDGRRARAGQHPEAILEELGMTRDAVTAWRMEGVI